jgi:hypothetical protein
MDNNAMRLGRRDPQQWRYIKEQISIAVCQANARHMSRMRFGVDLKPPKAPVLDEGAEVLEGAGFATHTSSAVLGSIGTTLGSSGTGRTIVTAILRRSESVVAESDWI